MACEKNGKWREPSIHVDTSRLAPTRDSALRLTNAAFETARAWQFQYQFIPDVQRSYARRSASEDYVAGLQ